MKIGFVLGNNGIKDVDCRFPEEGNPGIGGTEYTFILLIHFLIKHLEKKNDSVVVLAPELEKLPSNFEKIKCKDIYDACDNYKKWDLDLIVFRPAENMETFDYISKTNGKFIAWGHDFISLKTIKRMSEVENIYRYICVGREQAERFRDHKIFKKTNYIYNIFDYDLFKKNINLNKKEKIVTYIGNLSYGKGFHVLARIWKKIIKEVPGAKLNVIGSGKLYDRNLPIGKLGLAEEGYENLFMQYLKDENGNVLDSVKFWGTLGNEKNEIISKTMVGVPNPIGLSETFGITALEFQASGVPVVTRKCIGYMDTVNNNSSGYLTTNDKGLSEKIIKLLKDDEFNKKRSLAGIDFVSEKFNKTKILNKWENVFREVCVGEKNKILKFDTNRFFKLKYIIEINRILKKIIPFGQNLPSIVEYNEKLRKVLKK